VTKISSSALLSTLGLVPEQVAQGPECSPSTGTLLFTGVSQLGFVGHRRGTNRLRRLPNEPTCVHELALVDGSGPCRQWPSRLFGAGTESFVILRSMMIRSSGVICAASLSKLSTAGLNCTVVGAARRRLLVKEISVALGGCAPRGWFRGHDSRRSTLPGRPSAFGPAKPSAFEVDEVVAIRGLPSATEPAGFATGRVHVVALVDRRAGVTGNGRAVRRLMFVMAGVHDRVGRPPPFAPSSTTDPWPFVAVLDDVSSRRRTPRLTGVSRRSQ